MVGIVKVDTLQNNAGTSSVDMDYVVNGSAKAFSAATYSSGTPVEEKSFNISSLSDDATGKMTHNFTNSFSDSSLVGATANTYGSLAFIRYLNRSTTGVQTTSYYSADQDAERSMATFGDLA